MWCTACNDCAFSYRTGAIETVIHNPHYAEYVRNRGQIVERPVGEIRCGREIDHYMANDLERAVRRRMTREKTEKRFVEQCVSFIINQQSTTLTDEQRHTILTRISSICQGIIHLRQVELRRFMVDRLTNNTDLRVQLLLGNITEEQFNTKVVSRDKKTEKYREVLLVLQMLLDSSTDVVYRFADHMRQLPAQYTYASYDDFMTTGGGSILNEIDELRTYTNQCLEKIGRKYQNKSLYISDNRWTIHIL
jgi:CII-binding regulator of phage lambda lysogenization HflD